MIKKQVWVVTGIELGWDCVVAVFDASVLKLFEVSEMFPPLDYVITLMEVDIDV